VIEPRDYISLIQSKFSKQHCTNRHHSLYMISMSTTTQAAFNIGFCFTILNALTAPLKRETSIVFYS